MDPYRQWLREQRERVKHWTQEDAVRELDRLGRGTRHPSWISRVETGKVGIDRGTFDDMTALYGPPPEGIAPVVEENDEVARALRHPEVRRIIQQSVQEAAAGAAAEAFERGVEYGRRLEREAPDR